MNNAQIETDLEALPDLVAECLVNFRKQSLEKERVHAKTYLEIKARTAGEKVTVGEIEAMITDSQEYYKACLEEIEAEGKYTRENERLMAAKKIAGLRTAF